MHGEKDECQTANCKRVNVDGRIKKRNGVSPMNILALTSVYPQPDDGTEVVTPTVEYFCQKWSEAGHRVIVIHCNSCFPALFYAIPDNFRAKLSSKFGHNLPTKASRKPLSRESKGVKVYRLPILSFLALCIINSFLNSIEAA
jgi:hypothetical protein